MKQKLILCVIVFLLSGNYIIGQNNWHSGYILKTEVDTIYGFIDLRDSRSNSSQCYFRKEKTEPVQIFKPDELLGYRYTGGKYFLSKNIKDHNLDKTVFLEFLIEGKLNVYHYRDDSDRYFVEKDGELYELKNTEEKVEIDHVKYERDKKEYIGLLNHLMKEADIQSAIESSNLEAKSLIHIARVYHDKVCTDEKCVIYEMNVKPVRIVFSLHGGVTFNKFTFGNVLTTAYGMGKTIGGKFEFLNTMAWNDNIAVEVDFSLQQFTNYTLKIAEGDRALISYENEYYTIWKKVFPSYLNSLDVDMKSMALKIPVSATYTLSKGKLQPYLGLGFINMFVLSQNTDFVYSIFYDEYGKSIPGYHYGAVGKIGSKYQLKNEQSVYFEFNYESTQSASVNQYLRLKNSLYSICVGYAF